MLKSKKSPHFLAEMVQIWPLCCSQWDEDAKLQTGHKVGDRGRRSVVVPPIPAAAPGASGLQSAVASSYFFLSNLLGQHE